MNLKTIVGMAVIACLTCAPAFAKKENDKHKQLPPGLQKKLERGGALPPGWEKKIVRGELLDESIYENSKTVIPVDADGAVTVRVEDKLIKVLETTREIIDIVDLLNR